MLESKIQLKIIKQYEAEGYFVIKLIKTNKNGIPDLLICKDGAAFFVEVKAKNGKLSEIQKYRIEELKKYGMQTLVRNE
jgi:Holliday junction resolvase